MRTATAALKELELLHHLPKRGKEREQDITHPALQEMENNLIRLLSAALALLTHTAFSLEKAGPVVTYTRFAEAATELEARNRALFLDPTVIESLLPQVRRNMERISHVSLIGRVGLHLSRFELLVENATERGWIVNALGPSADAILLLGTCLINLLKSPPDQNPRPIEAALYWELLMVEGSLSTAWAELAQTGALSRAGRRYLRATIWSLEAVHDSLVALYRT